jgi:hypothetical protein
MSFDEFGRERHSKLTLSCLTPEFHEKTCGYWYTVTSDGSPYTAFATAEELAKWLAERGLKLTDTLPEERGTYKWMRIEGTYYLDSYTDIEAFNAIKPILEITITDNGEDTLGKVTEDECKIRTLGKVTVDECKIRTIHYLNVNVREKETL